VYLYDPSASIIAMELLGPPNIILRHGIVAGHLYPAAAKHIGGFLADTLFHTSLLAMDAKSFRLGGWLLPPLDSTASSVGCFWRAAGCA
jgi:5-methylthioribose kinase